MLQQTFGGAPNYITFLTPGVVCVVSLTTISFMGVDVVLDRLSGFLDTVSTYPIPRDSIYLGAAIQNIAKVMATAVVTFVLALFVPNGLRLAPGFGVINALGIFVTFALLSFVFSSLFAGIAIFVKTTDSFFAVVNFLALPFWFTSTALFPIAFFPSWLKPYAQANPISLASNAARLLIVNGPLSPSQASSFLTDIAGLALCGFLFAVMGIMMARRALRPA